MKEKGQVLKVSHVDQVNDSLCNVFKTYSVPTFSISLVASDDA
jgi:hypothetical protein